MTTIAKKIWTDAEVLAIACDGQDFEIIDGELLMSPTGWIHGLIIGRLFTALGAAVQRAGIGEIFDGQTGFRMPNGDVLSPDISVATTARVEQNRQQGATFFGGSPELVIEVLSPGETQGMTERKIRQYFEGGALLGWVVNPGSRTVLVYHGTMPDRLLTAADSLDGEAVVPGFILPLARLFG